MAYGDTTITYPIRFGPIGRGGNFSHIDWIFNVISGPTTVGQAGTFEFLIEYGDTTIVEGSRDVDYTASPSFEIATAFTDYPPNRIERVDLQGSVFPPGRGPTSFTRTYGVPAGWKFIDFTNGYAYGSPFDPTPFGAVSGQTLYLWDGAYFTVSPDLPARSGFSYADRNQTGINHTFFAVGYPQGVNGAGAYFTVEIASADGQRLTEFPLTYYTPNVTINPDSGYVAPPLEFTATDARRIYSINVLGRTFTRSGSYSASYQFGTIAPNPADGGGGATAGGTAIQTGIVRGNVRGFQSGAHTRVARSGGGMSLG